MKITAYSHVYLADEKLAKYIFDKIMAIAKEEEDIVIAVSGGSTPFRMYKILAEKLVTINSDIHVVQVDERYVPSTHERSNQRQLSEIFESSTTFLPMTTPENSSNLNDAVTNTEREYNQLLTRLGKSGVDIMILGMGTDGHTASMFPKNETYLQSRDKPKGIIGMYVESQKENRISLNSNFINSSSMKILYAHGEGKLSTLNDALRDGNEELYPILNVIADTHLFTVYHQMILDFTQLWKFESID